MTTLALRYQDPDGAQLTFNVDWPDNVSMVPPPEIVLADVDGNPIVYTYMPAS